MLKFNVKQTVTIAIIVIQIEKQILPADRVQRIQLGRRFAAIFVNGDANDVIGLGRVHETMARAAACRQIGDGRVHRTGGQGEIRVEYSATGADGQREATRTASTSDKMDCRYMSAALPGKQKNNH